MCDVAGAKLIEVVKTRDFIKVAAWVKERPESFREGIEVGTLDMSNTYAAVFSVTLLLPARQNDDGVDTVHDDLP